MWLALALACTHPPDDSAGDDTVEDSDTIDTNDTTDSVDTGVDLNTDLDTATPEHDTTVIGIAGGATWNVDFDADAEAAGYVDCSYHRAYADGAEIRDVPWLCPDCDVLTRVNVTMDAGLDDCYASITNGGAPSPVEYLGWNGAAWMRASTPNLVLTAQGVPTITADTITWTNDTPYEFTDADGNEWHATFHIVGEVAISDVTADPYRGLWPPDTYECGWPKSDAPVYEGPYTVAIGETLPDGVFRDVCNDAVRLHDLLGEWLVIDVSAKDCGPCQTMADQAPAALEALAAEGIDARTVTFLAPALDDTLATASRQDLYDWTIAFDLDDPVLADRGYAPFVIGPATTEQFGEDFGYPTWLIVSPEGTVVAGNVGFSSWDAIATVLRDNQ